MIERLTSAERCREVTNKHLDYFTFDASAWFADIRNHAYIEDKNIAFAEYKSPGHYHVHFCFDTARGRQAIDLCHSMLSHLAKDTDWQTIVGIVVKENRKAVVVVRRLGMKYLGDIETKNGPSEMFYMTRNKE